MNKALTVVTETLREEVPLYGASSRTSVIRRALTARQAYQNSSAEKPHGLDKKA